MVWIEESWYVSLFQHRIFKPILIQSKNSRTLRRLATDHAALHNQHLPPNYLFPPTSTTTSDNLTDLDILLAGPTHTPFASGLWKLHLTIPPTYPSQPPTAHFRTPIFHPNVEPQTGAVCVETLKRDWESTLTLRDVLITISCLLIQPNPDSALNAEAGRLIREDFEAFARGAKLMTGIHAGVPKGLREAVREAQLRGQEGEGSEMEGGVRNDLDSASASDAVVRRKKATARQRGTVASHRSDGSPSAGMARSRIQPDPSRPFVVQTRIDDVFGATDIQQQEQTKAMEDDDSSMMDGNQENDESKSPTKAKTPMKATTPKRPQGLAVPLGELTMDEVTSDLSSSDEDNEAEPEYPPSPKKSPSKSPSKHRHLHQQSSTTDDSQRAESSRDAARRAPNITPPNNLSIKPLAEDSPFASTSSPAGAERPSPRKPLFRPHTPTSASVSKRAPLFSPLKATPQKQTGSAKQHKAVSKTKKKSPSSSEKKKRKEELDAKLWELCGRDVRRWNRGDFGEGVFKVKAGRW